MEKLRKLAAQGDAEALHRLGDIYLEGVPQDYEEAFKNLLQAAELGLAEAQAAIGEMYKNGHGVPKDEEEAVEWYQKAADQGDPDGQYLLGMAYWLGNGVPKNSKRATTLLKKAALKGHSEAQSHIACLYQSGNGVPQDCIEAYKWFTLCGDAPFGPNLHDYSLYILEELVTAMTPVQIKVAEKLAKAMKRKIDAMKSSSKA
jgi:hypothetical protein